MRVELNPNVHGRFSVGYTSSFWTSVNVLAFAATGKMPQIRLVLCQTGRIGEDRRNSRGFVLACSTENVSSYSRRLSRS